MQKVILEGRLTAPSLGQPQGLRARTHVHPTRASGREGCAGTHRLLFRVLEFLLLVVVPALEEMQQEQVAEHRGLESKHKQGWGCPSSSPVPSCAPSLSGFVPQTGVTSASAHCVELLKSVNPPKVHLGQKRSLLGLTPGNFNRN